MRNLEDYQDAVEYDPQPQRIFKTFTADIYECGNLDPQTVTCYPIYLEGDVLDVEIKMMILVKPEAIREDVAAGLYSEYPELTLGNLHFRLSPKEYAI